MAKLNHRYDSIIYNCQKSDLCQDNFGSEMVCDKNLQATSYYLVVPWKKDLICVVWGKSHLNKTMIYIRNQPIITVGRDTLLHTDPYIELRPSNMRKIILPYINRLQKLSAFV